MLGGFSTLRFLGGLGLLACCLLSAQPLLGAEGQVADSVPKRGVSVGLALSGGGAKGLAHIGVIRALEEYGIPIDYIAGTSMGAIVGALYAVGYSTEDMVRIFKSEEMRRWNTGEVAEKDRYYFFQYPPDPRMFTISVRRDDTAFRLILPSHLMPTTDMDIGFMELAAEGNGVARGNFDRLFRPFRCVASDVYRKRPKVFRQGDLATAVRASMTYPMLFRPVEVEGEVFFDGGLYNNYPWDVVRDEFSPDLIVGSNVSYNSPPAKVDDLFGQLVNLVMAPTQYDVPPEIGVSINSQVLHIGMLDFDMCDSLVAVGYRAAMARMPEIAARVGRRVDTAQLRRERMAFNARKMPLIFSRQMEIEGLNAKQAKHLERAVSKRRNAFSSQSFRKEYYRLTADCHIDRIYPQARYDSATQLYRLHLSVRKAPSWDISLGGNISTHSLNMMFVGVDYKIFSSFSARLYANGTVGSLYSNAEVGWRHDIMTERPFSYTAGYVFNRYDYHTTSPIAIFEDSRPPFIKQKDSYAFGRLSLPVTFHSELDLSVNYGVRFDSYYQVERYLRKDIPDETTTRYLNGGLSFSRETLNYKLFPTAGQKWYFRLWGYLLNEHNLPGTTSVDRTPVRVRHKWLSVHAYYERYVPFDRLRRFTLGWLLDAQMLLKTELHNYTSDLLLTPRFAPTPVMHSLFVPHLHAKQYVAVGVMPTLMVRSKFYLQAKGYLFMPMRPLVSTRYNTPVYGVWLGQYHWLGEAALMYQTPIGPLSVSLTYLPGWREDAWSSMVLSVNLGFALFKNSGMVF